MSIDNNSNYFRVGIKPPGRIFNQTISLTPMGEANIGSSEGNNQFLELNVDKMYLYNTASSGASQNLLAMDEFTHKVVKINDPINYPQAWDEVLINNVIPIADLLGAKLIECNNPGYILLYLATNTNSNIYVVDKVNLQRVDPLTNNYAINMLLDITDYYVFEDITYIILKDKNTDASTLIRLTVNNDGVLSSFGSPFALGNFVTTICVDRKDASTIYAYVNQNETAPAFIIYNVTDPNVAPTPVDTSGTTPNFGSGDIAVESNHIYVNDMDNNTVNVYIINTDNTINGPVYTSLNNSKVKLVATTNSYGPAVYVITENAHSFHTITRTPIWFDNVEVQITTSTNPNETMKMQQNPVINDYLLIYSSLGVITTCKNRGANSCAPIVLNRFGTQYLLTLGVIIDPDYSIYSLAADTESITPSLVLSKWTRTE